MERYLYQKTSPFGHRLSYYYYPAVKVPTVQCNSCSLHDQSSITRSFLILLLVYKSSSQDPVGSSRDGSSSLWSPRKLRARWGQFRSNQPRSPEVCPVGPLPQRAHWCRSLRRPYGRITRRPKLENPGSRCLSPLSTK